VSELKRESGNSMLVFDCRSVRSFRW